jgi:hypothetical protein
MPDGSQKWQAYQTQAKKLWRHLHWIVDTVPHSAYDGRATLKVAWFQWYWHEFFDAYEFIVQLLAPTHTGERRKWFDDMNNLLEEEGCAYRFIAEELAPITNPTEIAAVLSASECAIASVGDHIREALAQLPPNPNSSPRNSVKESISAVEAALKDLTGEPAATLGEGLRYFEARYGSIHKSMRRGLDHLYAYTNSDGGIRHSLVDDATDVTVDDARFMVVTCSAFANYLVALSARKSNVT